MFSNRHCLHSAQRLRSCWTKFGRFGAHRRILGAKMLGVWHKEQLIDTDSLTLLKSITNPRQSKFTVAIEGNIGCGKSTLIEHFEGSPMVECCREPLEKWCNINGHNALELLYKDSKRWSFTFNNYAQLTRVDMHTKKTRKPVKMLERSLHSTQYIFVENNRRSGTITGLEHAILQEWFDYLVTANNIKVDLIVYLRANPQTCFDRIQKRARSEEAGVPYEFIEELHELHEDWLIRQTYSAPPGPVLVLDANLDMPQMVDVYEENRQQILCGYC